MSYWSQITVQITIVAPPSRPANSQSHLIIKPTTSHILHLTMHILNTLHKRTSYKRTLNHPFTNTPTQLTTSYSIDLSVST